MSGLAGHSLPAPAETASDGGPGPRGYGGMGARLPARAAFGGSYAVLRRIKSWSSKSRTVGAVRAAVLIWRLAPFGYAAELSVSEHLQAGIEAGKRQQLEKAAEHFEAAIRLEPNVLPAYLNLGAVRHLQEKFAPAVKAFSRAMELDEAASAEAGARGMLGYGLVKLERYAEAVAHLEYEQRESPGNPQAEFALALAYLRTGRAAEAVAGLDDLLRRHDDRREIASLVTEVLIEQAESAVREKDSLQAIEAYSRVLTIAPALAGIRGVLGDLHAENGDYETALDLYRQEVESAPGGEIHERIGSALLKLGKADEAIPHLRRAAETSIEAKSRLGQALLDVGSTSEAEEVFIEALEAEPSRQTQARVHYQLARLFRSGGEGEKARVHLAKFRELRTLLLEGGP